ncbi:ABC transporter ATP-binding protein, partial [Candidatus Saccharibacteria bacterium]|nr:ABC transporter ATP-binding protein [Candidatus Saccharibacteria bacterium]
MPRSRFVTQKPKNFKASLKVFFKSLKNYRLAILIPLIFAVAGNLLSLLSPTILGKMTNSAVASVRETGSLDLDFLKTSAFQLLVLYLVVAVLSYLQSFLLARMTALYTKSLRSKIIEKISRLPISYFDQHQFGDTLSVLGNDVDALSSSLSEEIVQIATNLTTVIGCLVMMFVISPSLALVSVLVIPLSTFAIAALAKKAQSHFSSQRTVLGKLNSHIEEDYSGQLIIKANSH